MSHVTYMDDSLTHSRDPFTGMQAASLSMHIDRARDAIIVCRVREYTYDTMQ